MDKSIELFNLIDLKDKNFARGVHEMYMLTDFNHKQYPDYTEWFYGTNVPRILKNEGSCLFCLDAFTVKGLVFLKNTDTEKKISTLLIDEVYRNQRLASTLLEASFKLLGTDKPLITIPETTVDDFSQIINRYGWKQTGCIKDYYSNEFVFNERL